MVNARVRAEVEVIMIPDEGVGVENEIAKTIDAGVGGAIKVARKPDARVKDGIQVARTPGVGVAAGVRVLGVENKSDTCTFFWINLIYPSCETLLCNFLHQLNFQRKLDCSQKYTLRHMLNLN